MNVVRICFQASYKDSSGQTRHLSPVLSEPIFDKSTWWWGGLHIPPPYTLPTPRTIPVPASGSGMGQVMRLHQPVPHWGPAQAAGFG